VADGANPGGSYQIVPRIEKGKSRAQTSSQKRDCDEIDGKIKKIKGGLGIGQKVDRGARVPKKKKTRGEERNRCSNNNQKKRDPSKKKKKRTDLAARETRALWMGCYEERLQESRSRGEEKGRNIFVMN